MTITWEWECGAHYGNDSFTYELVESIDTFVSSSNPMSGAYCYYMSSSGSWIRRATATASRQKRSGVFVRNAWPTSSYRRLLSAMDVSGNFLVEVRLNSDGTLALMVATVSQDTETAGAIPVSTYRHVGLDVKIDSSAGWAVVYVDGSEVMRFEGNTGNADIAYMQAGPHGASATGTWDNWYCEDTTGEAGAAVVPIRYFIETAPSGDGNYSQMTGSDGNQVSNYQLVDETTPNEDTDYVYATAADLIDSYAAADVAVGAGMTVNAVHPFVIAKKLGSAATQVKPFLRENSVDWAGTARDCSTDYELYIERRTTTPDGSAWGQTSVNGMETGAKSAGAYS